MSSDYDPMKETWHNRGVRGADYGTRHPVLAALGVTSAATLAIVVLVLACAAIGVVGWQIGWWFQSQDANRQTQVIRQSQGYQGNLQAEVDQLFGNIQQIGAQILSPSVKGKEVAALKASRYADLTQLCGYAAQATSGTLDSQQQSFVSANCSNGAVNPASQYAQP